jgi:hypothetical protein
MASRSRVWSGLFISSLLLSSGIGIMTGCASPSEDDGTTEALRAPRSGDLQIEVLGTTPAVGAPGIFAGVTSWSVDYVNMRDPDPNNAYSGLLFYAHGADGEVRYYMTYGWGGPDAVQALAAARSAPSVLVFDAKPDAKGNLVEARLTPKAADLAAQTAELKAMLDWVLSEQRRVLEIAASKRRAITGSTGSVKPASLFDATECGFHAAALLLLLKRPKLYLVADGLVDIAFGALNPKPVQVLKGAAELAAGEAIVRGKLGKKFNNTLLVGVVGVAAYNVYDQGVVGGLAETGAMAIPDACKDLF